PADEACRPAGPCHFAKVALHSQGKTRDFRLKRSCLCPTRNTTLKRVQMTDARNMSMKSLILAEIHAVDYRPVTTSILAKAMKVTKKDLREFREALAELIERGRIRQDKQGRLRPR